MDLRCRRRPIDGLYSPEHTLEIARALPDGVGPLALGQALRARLDPGAAQGAGAGPRV